jgi:hypothetical protein
MGDRPPAVHIDDLAEPRFPPEVQELFDGAAAMADAVELTADALCAQAAAETGLDDFGDDPSWFERLELVLRCLETEAGLSPMGRVTTSVQYGQLAKNRLLITDLLARHPEIHDEEIRRPIIIAGLPRTGTTHLHSLLSADPTLRSLPYWESLEPVLGAEEAAAVAAGGPDPRLARTEAGTAFLDLAAPLFKRMHEMTVDHVHEEIQLLAVDLSSLLTETTAPMPTWRDHFLAHDQTPHYEYLKTVLKVLQWQRGGERWVLKSPQHLEQYGPIRTVFPDATVLVTHRDPVSVTASMSTMIAYTARLHCDPVDPVAIGHYWADRLDRMLAACDRDRDRLPADQSMDVHFDRFMADDMGTVEAIYELADQPFDDRARRALADYGDTHPRGRHGGLIYDLADFDLDADELRTRFVGYTSRFQVAEEPW